MMEYRKLPHGEEQISVIGFGTSSIGAAGETAEKCLFPDPFRSGLSEREVWLDDRSGLS